MSYFSPPSHLFLSSPSAFLLFSIFSLTEIAMKSVSSGTCRTICCYYIPDFVRLSHSVIRFCTIRPTNFFLHLSPYPSVFEKLFYSLFYFPFIFSLSLFSISVIHSDTIFLFILHLFLQNINYFLNTSYHLNVKILLLSIREYFDISDMIKV